MLIHACYQIEKLCASRDSLSSVMGYVKVEAAPTLDDSQAGLAIAANGFAMAVVPVTLETDDVPGLVDRRAFSLARKHLHGAGVAQLLLGATTVRLPQQYLALDRLGDLADAKFPPSAEGYPDWRQAVPGLQPAAALAVPATWAFDPGLLREVVEALGGKRSGVYLTWAKPDGPLLVRTTDQANQERAVATGIPLPPYGVLMPMQSTVTASANADAEAPHG